eukprot:12506077-Alexandrium_andersonii.AAC.1
MPKHSRPALLRWPGRGQAARRGATRCLWAGPELVVDDALAEAGVEAEACREGLAALTPSRGRAVPSNTAL